MFRGGTTFVGPEMCAYDRAKMLTGATATQDCSLRSRRGDCAACRRAERHGRVRDEQPVALAVPRRLGDAGELDLHRADDAAVAAFTPACMNGGACIPQAGTSQPLDS